ncbi:MAG: DNA cytosine methyltransferase [Candidatus Aenigmatarchaeota archaeon]
MRSLNTIDLFCGAGGLTLGFERQGFQAVAASDYQEDTLNTYKTNFPEVATIQKDIRELEAEELLAESGYDKEDIDAIIGGPPCKGFSMAGERDPDDPRNSLFEEYIRIVSEIEPRVVVMENVKGILSMQDGAYVDKILKELRKLGYTVKYRVLNAADYGVPETRERVIWIGFKNGEKISFPDPTHHSKTDGQKKLGGDKGDLKPYRTVGEAISDLDFVGPGEKATEYQKEPESEYQERMRENASELLNHEAPNHSERVQNRFKLMEEGKGMETVPEEYRTSKHSLQKLHRDEPSPTITTLPEDFVHYKRNRIPTVREVARIQSFPDDFEFTGPRTTGGMRRREACPQYSQIGNAVPPIMAEAIAKEVRQSFQS